MGGKRRLSQVLVEIPPSAPSDHPSHVSSSRKENALRASASRSTITSMNTSKRKQDEPHDQPSKKAKVETSVKSNTTRQPLANASLDFPNGFVYCHQCNKKRDAAITAQCTFQDVKSNRRCAAKYCAPCLRNRYGTTLQDVLSTKTIPLEQKKRHVSGEGYFYKCPRCEGTCNCVHCRKVKGLAPTGNLTLTARSSGLRSVADVLLHDPTAAGPMAGKKKPRTRKSASQPTTTTASSSKSKSTKGAPRMSTCALLPTPKPLPTVLWTPIHTRLSLRGAEDRIYIREFAVRFLSLSRAHLDEMEMLSRSRRRFSEDDKYGDLEPWVSEGCLKALLIALLGMIEMRDAKVLSATINALHHHWFLSKIVETLRTLIAETGINLPCPTAAPEDLLQSVPIIKTRSSRTSSHQAVTRTSEEPWWPEVVCTSQLIPVISDLVDRAVRGQAIRDALEEGTKEAKELTKDSIELKKALEQAEKDKREREKMEKEQADKDKKGEAKGKGRVHAKEKVVKDSEDEPRHSLTPKTALTIALSSCAQRVAPLGRDSEGRVYWALTPGRGERDASREYLTSDVGHQGGGSNAKSKAAKSKSAWTPPSLAERASHKRWSWFVAVWGIRPCAEERRDPPKDEVDSEDDTSDSESEHGSDSNEDEDKIKSRKERIRPERPRWYAFSDPTEIFKLAEWVDRKAELLPRSASSSNSKLQPISTLPSRATSSSTLNNRTSAFSYRTASSLSNKFKATHTHTKLSDSPLTDVEIVSSSEVEDSENDSDSTGENQNIENESTELDMPCTPQLQSLARELRAYAELLKNRA